MYTLGPEDKATLVMAYTNNLLVRGEAVTKQSVRVNVWLRTDSAPVYIHMLNPQVVVFGGGAPRPSNHAEIYLPTAEVIGFHPVPPSDDVLDYDPKEPNRVMEPASALMGTFLLKGKLRFSGQTGLGTTLEVGRAVWMSIYDTDIINPLLPQLNLHVPMLLVRPNKVSFVV